MDRLWWDSVVKPCPECGGLLVEGGKDKHKCAKCETVFELEEAKE